MRPPRTCLRRAAKSFAVVAVLACGVGSAGALGAGENPVAAQPPENAASETGWARAIFYGQELRDAIGMSSPVVGEAPSTTLAAKVRGIQRDEEGTVWLSVLYPNGGPQGWVPAEELRAVAPFEPLPRRTAERLNRLVATAGSRSAVVVRDEYGRSLYSRGTRRPLILASVTKLFTVGAGLDLFGPRVRPAPILGPSDNLLAQRLMNELGGGANGPGTTWVRRYASTLGADVRLSDGSGLSYSNRAPAAEVVDFLERVRDQDYFPALRRGLPSIGVSGTLAGRLREPATRGRVRAKTGTLDPVTTLAGYLRPRGAALGPKRELTFAILMNRISPSTGRALQDSMLRALISRP